MRSEQKFAGVKSDGADLVTFDQWGPGPPNNWKPCHPVKFDGLRWWGRVDNKVEYNRVKTIINR